MIHNVNQQKISLPEWLSINPWAIVLIVAALVVGILLGAQHSKLPELANVIVGPAVVEHLVLMRLVAPGAVRFGSAASNGRPRFRTTGHIGVTRV